MSAVAYAVAAPSFVERVADLLERVDFRRADTDEIRESIFRLRYDAYLTSRSIQPNFERRFTDPEDEVGNAWIFGVYLDDKLVSSIRLHVATRDFPELPSLEVFPDFLQRALDSGKTIIDPTRFVIDRTASRKYPHLHYITTRLAWIACAYFDADMLLAAVRTEHQAFYRRVFGHQVVCEARPYPLLDKPISLMSLDYFPAREEVQRGYPFFRSSVFERRMLFERLQQPAEAPRRRPPLRLVEPAGNAAAHAG